MEGFRKLTVGENGHIYGYSSKVKRYCEIICGEEDMFPIEVKKEIRKEREKARELLEMPEI